MNRNSRVLAALAAILVFCGPRAARAQESQKMSMRQAVTLALQNSRDLALARVQYTVALNEARLDHAAFLPNLYTGSGAAYTYGFPSISGGPPAVFEMAYNQEFFNPLLKGQQRAAEDRAKNMKLEMDRMHDDVIVRTATAYLELAKVRHSLDLMRKEQNSAGKILEVMRDRVAANQELPMEVTRAELAQARIAERIIKLEDRDDAVEQQIRNLTGVADGQAIEVETEEPSFENSVTDAETMNLGLKNDWGVQEAENERAARQQLLHGARLSYWPTVQFVGQYSVLSKFNNYDEFYKTFQRNNLNIGVQVTIPIFAAKTRASVALANSQLKAAELTLGNKRQEARLDIDQKARGVRELDATREVARLDLKLAQETLQMTQAKFDQGQVTLRDIEQARLDESDKWVSFLDADFARQQGQLTLLQATGQLVKVFQ
jgi:outer membrane protein